MNERRLTGRDVLAKTFPAKTKKGFDPVDVDSYLELVAAQIDLLHADLEASGGSGAHDSDSDTTALEEAMAERDALEARLTEELQAGDALRAENEQLRLQLTAVAPPPPVSGAATTTELVAEEREEISASIVPAQSSDLVVDDRAAQESYELVLRAAQRTAEEAISQAHVRADEIVEDANLNAARIAQESDRKAYEAANRAHKELTEIKGEIETQHALLETVTVTADERRAELRAFGASILQWAEEDAVLDLRDSETETAASALDTEA